MKNLILSFWIILFSLNPVFSQEDEKEYSDNEKHKAHEEHFHRHAVSLAMSHTYIASGLREGQVRRLIVPSLGLNYNFNINEKWAIGLHNDLIIEDFEVEDPNAHKDVYKSEEETIAKLHRSKPVSSAIMLSYKPFEHLALMAGGGMEFSKEENFGVIRMGLEVPFHIPNNWEIFGAFMYDMNISAYDSFTFGLGIAKLF